MLPVSTDYFNYCLESYIKWEALYTRRPFSPTNDPVDHGLSPYNSQIRRLGSRERGVSTLFSRLHGSIKRGLWKANSISAIRASLFHFGVERPANLFSGRRITQS